MGLPIIARIGASALGKDKKKKQKKFDVSVEINSNAKQVEKRLREAGKDINESVKRALSITAQEGINIIERRTKRSVGFKGGKFTQYSPKYARFRRFRGRTNKPNLEFKGHMLGAMTSKADSKKATIFFTRAAEAKKAAGNNKLRPFFGFNRKEEKKLGDIFFRNIK
jgi:hypothetical protein